MRFKVVAFSRVDELKLVTISEEKCEELTNRLYFFKNVLMQQMAMIDDSLKFIRENGFNDRDYVEELNVLREQINQAIHKADNDISLLQKLSDSNCGLSIQQLKSFEYETQMPGLNAMFNGIAKLSDSVVLSESDIVNQMRSQYMVLRSQIKDSQDRIMLKSINNLMILVNKGSIRREEIIAIKRFLSEISGKIDNLEKYIIEQLEMVKSNSSDTEKQIRMEAIIQKIKGRFSQLRIVLNKIQDNLASELKDLNLIIPEIAKFCYQSIMESNISAQDKKELNNYFKSFKLDEQLIFTKYDKTQEKVLSKSAKNEERKQKENLQLILERLDKLLKEKQKESQVSSFDSNKAYSKNILSNEKDFEDIFV